MKTTYKLIFGLFALLALTACTSTDFSYKPILGNVDAPVLVEEFSDYECPYCASIGSELEEVIKKNSDIARLQFYHFPLFQHPRAFPAAEAAECAADQNKFWEYSRLLFKNQRNLTDDHLKTYASNLNLDTDAFNKCFDDHQFKARVKNDLYEGRRRKVNSTPSIFVNGQLLKWSGPEDFETYLKSLR